MRTRSMAFIFVGVISVVLAGYTAPPVDEGSEEFMLNHPGMIMAHDHYDMFIKALDAFSRKAPEYRRLRFVLDMKQALDDSTPLVPLKGYRKGEGDLDLNTRSGRIRCIIERILDQVDERAREPLDARIDRWMSAAMKRNLKTKEQIAALKQRYFGKIKVGQYASAKGVDEAAELLDQFFCDWFPYGKTVAELEGILGLKCTVKGEHAEIEMVDPDGETCLVRLATRDGIIVRVAD